MKARDRQTQTKTVINREKRRKPGKGISLINYFGKKGVKFGFKKINTHTTWKLHKLRIKDKTVLQDFSFVNKGKI